MKAAAEQQELVYRNRLIDPVRALQLTQEGLRQKEGTTSCRRGGTIKTSVEFTRASGFSSQVKDQPLKTLTQAQGLLQSLHIYSQ